MKPVDNLARYLEFLSNEARALDELIRKTQLQLDGYRNKYETLLGIASRLVGDEFRVMEKELKNIRNNLDTTKLIVDRQRTRHTDLLVLIKIIEEELNT